MNYPLSPVIGRLVGHQQRSGRDPSDFQLSSPNTSVAELMLLSCKLTLIGANVLSISVIKENISDQGRSTP
jgi:hypothetical protein